MTDTEVREKLYQAALQSARLLGEDIMKSSWLLPNWSYSKEDQKKVA